MGDKRKENCEKHGQKGRILAKITLNYVVEH